MTDATPSAATTTRHSRHFRTFAFVYVLFIVYVTTIPFSFGLTSEQVMAHFHRVSWIPFFNPDGSRASLPDMVQNVVLFAPLGLLLVMSLARRVTTPGARIATATGLGLLLSVTVETLQLFTTDRTTSATDVATNTIGTCLGAWSTSFFASLLAALHRHPRVERLLSRQSAYPVLASLAIVTVGAWQPFDFTLDVGTILSKAHSLWRHPIDIPSMPSDEVAIALRMALLVVALASWFRDGSVEHPRRRALGIGLLLGVGLEASQLFIESRMPGAQDALSACLGALGGFAVLPRVRAASARTWAWTTIVLTILSAAVADLSPFQISSEASRINLVPFIAHYTRSDMAPLADFLDAAILYLPMGFVVAVVFGRRTAWWLALAVTATSSLALEMAQRFIETRYADITDPLAAILGAAVGVYAWQRRPAFYVRDEARHSAI